MSGFPICFVQVYYAGSYAEEGREAHYRKRDRDPGVADRRDNVLLGIKAPAHISIYRYEIYEAIKNENVSAVTSQIPDKDTLEKISKEIKAK